MTYQRLKLNRFIAIRDETVNYDQEFHDGINVIRGEHSVGKSTLLDLIFYSLGGELKEKEWKEPIELYDEVVSEVSIGSRVLTLSRKIQVNGKKPPIFVFEGSFDKSQYMDSKWVPLGPVRSENKMSFSEFLFEALGWGQSITSDNSNLTMHQLMRLLYLSQSSDSTKILRSEVEEKFDRKSTRNAIGDFLLGLDDLSLYNTRQEIWRTSRELDSIRSDIRSYQKLLNVDELASVDDFDEQIKSKSDELKRSMLDKTEALERASNYISEDFSDIVQLTSTRIAYLTNDIKILTERESYIRSEISDCLLFGKSLSFRLKSLTESKDTFVSLGEVSFSYCPSCFSAITESEDSCHCSLCKNELPEHSLTEKYIETLSELKYQQRQNDKTIEKLKLSLEQTSMSLAEVKSALRKEESKLRSVSTSTNERELIIEKYSRKLSLLESELEKIIASKDIFLKIDVLIQEKTVKEKRLSTLEKEVLGKEDASKERRYSVLNNISSSAKKLLELDLENEHRFNQATSLSDEIDFGKDEWSIGGRVTFSDSSNVVKKSSLHIAMLEQSLSDTQCRLPNFMILDFECGDLNAPRSHKLQQNLMSTLAEYTNYQVIITSSKVCSELNNEHYGVGPYYATSDYIFK